MARKSSQRLQALLKLAQLKEQQAARQLGEANGRLEQAQRQSSQLVQYRDEYQGQYLERTGGQSFSRRDLLNYQGFFQQLEHVQEQQQRVIEQRDGERDQARDAWLDLYSRRLLLQRVRERRLQREQQEADKKQQRELDDRAARRERR